MRAGTVIASSEYVGVDDEAIVNGLIEAVNKRCIESARMATFLGMLLITRAGAETIARKNKQREMEQKRGVRDSENGMLSYQAVMAGCD
jgi:hypothetical protein